MMKIQEYLSLEYVMENVWEKIHYAFCDGCDNLEGGYLCINDKYKVFAIMGFPKSVMPKEGYPAVVLVHGGAGKAYPEWVKKWTDNGYIAIAPDFDGHFINDKNENVVNDYGGPRGYGSFGENESDNPWVYFSVLSIKKAIDFLYQQDVVNKKQIGLCGISWGGFIGLIAAAIEKRIKATEIFYSSAFISDSEWGYNRGFKNLTKEETVEYNRNFDPQSYLKKIVCPICFLAGTDDIAFTMRNRKRTTDLIDSKKTFSYRLHFPHGHYEAWEGNEDVAFMDAEFKRKKIPNFSDAFLFTDKEYSFSVVYTEEDYKTKDCVVWQTKEYKSAADIPKTAKSFFITAEDEKGIKFSSDIIDNSGVQL